jgi:hypothetical protein
VKVALLLGLSGVSLAAQSRFYAAATAATAIVLLASAGGRRASPRPARLVVVVALAVAGLYTIYPLLAANGAFGERAKSQQLVGGNILARNRPEVFQALVVVRNHPVLGIGSKGTLSTEESDDALAFASKLAGPLYDRQYLQGLDVGGKGYATHSQALDTASSAGVLSLGFWALLLLGIAQRLRRLGRSEDAAAPLIFMSLLTAWDAFFSPLSGLTHISIAVTVFLVAQQPRVSTVPDVVSGVQTATAGNRRRAASH